jgi:hypothetical protein
VLCAYHLGEHGRVEIAFEKRAKLVRVQQLHPRVTKVVSAFKKQYLKVCRQLFGVAPERFPCSLKI